MLLLAQILISVALLSPVIFTLPVTEDSVIDGSTSDLDEDSNDYGEAEAGQFPYHASFRYKSFGTFKVCAGVIISANFVLTSAACNLERRLLTVFVGDPKYYHYSKDYYIKRVIRHESYYRNLSETGMKGLVSKRNDIALIETRIPIKFNKFVAPIALERSFINGGVKAVTTGLDDEVTTGNGAEPLKFAKEVTMSNQQCRELLKKKGHDIQVDSHVVCAEKPPPLLYDTGAPLAANNKLIGITSWDTVVGVNKYKFAYPVAYTRISDYIDWIERKTKLTF